VQWSANYRRSWLLILGLLGGFGAGVKLTGFFIVAAACVPVVLAWLLGAHRRRGVPLVDLLVLGVGSTIASAPWLVRTFIATGNPVFPFLNSVFRSPLADNTVVYFGKLHTVGNSWQDYLLLPVRIVFDASRYVEAGTYNVLFLALIPALLAILRVSTRFLLICCFVCVLAVLWLVSDVNLRYGLAAVALMIVTLAALFTTCLASQGRGWLSTGSTGALAAVAVAGVLFHTASSWWFLGQASSAFPYRVVFGAQTAEIYVSSKLPSYDGVAYLNRTLGTTARVWAPLTRDYLYPHFDFMVAQDYWMGKQKTLEGIFYSTASPDAVHQALRTLGFTHLLIDTAALQSHPHGATIFTYTLFNRAFLEDPRYVQIEYASRGVNVYRLIVPEEPRLAAAAHVNLLRDGGFEQFGNGPSPWQPTGKPGIERDNGRAASGTAAMRVNGANYVQQSVPVREGGLYRLAFRARAMHDEARARFEVRWLDGTGKPLRYYWVPFRVGSTYDEAVFYETAPAGARQAVVFKVGLTAQDEILVDDVELVELIARHP
jgi:hypothetical protein